MQNTLLVILGPTGVGKSALAIDLAKQFHGEIVSADSRQIYKYMNIGTAKPSTTELSTTPHHIIDIINPDEIYSLAFFLHDAVNAIKTIHKQGKIPILVGGTGQWLWALIEGWNVPEIPPNQELRLRLTEQSKENGYMSLHAELSKLNPSAASKIDARNVRRVIRALELCYSDIDIQQAHQKQQASPYKTLIFGLTMDRSALYGKIDNRVDKMIESGWINEVGNLLDMGFHRELPSLSSLGYQEIIQYLSGEISQEYAVTQIKNRTHKFARNQNTWFKQTDQRIKWLDPKSAFRSIDTELTRWIKNPN